MAKMELIFTGYPHLIGFKGIHLISFFQFLKLEEKECFAGSINILMRFLG